MSLNKKQTCSILLQFIQDPHLLIAHHQTNKGFPSYDANPRNMQIWAPYQVAVYIALSWLQQFYPIMHISSMHTLYSETPEQQHCAGQVTWPLLRVWLLSEVINTYFYVSRSMPLDCCREFGLSLGGLCSGVSLYKH